MKETDQWQDIGVEGKITL